MSFNLLKKEYRDCKTISKRINKQLSTKIIDKFLKTNDISSVSIFISRIIEYYIMSNDKKTNYSYDDLLEKIGHMSNGFSISEYYKNPIYATASNGYNKQNIKSSGFMNMMFDKELFDKLEYCEKLLGKSTYLEYQNSGNTDKPYIFFTMPGSLVVDYALKLAPERVFLGILSQDYPDVLPYKVGEGKRQYYNRLIEYKVRKGNIKDANLLEYSREIIDKLCDKKPIVSLFQKKDLKAYYNYIGNGDPQAVLDIANDIFCEDDASLINGGSYGNNAANMVTDDININKNYIGIIDIPDYFELLEIKAKQLGFSNGEEIDLLTLEHPELSQDKLEELHGISTGRLFEINLYGTDYLYKPAEAKNTLNEEKFRGKVQEAAYEVQKIVDPNSAVFCKYVENGYVAPGTVQQKLNVSDDFSNYKNSQIQGYIFTEEEVSQFMREFVTDYLLCNFDAHGGNFLLTKMYNNEKVICGIDKEQCFKYLNSEYDFLNINDNPNERYGEEETIYNTIFKQYLNGKNDFDLESMVDKYIARVEAVDEAKYRRIFQSYAASMSESFGVNENELLDKIILRKRELRYNLERHFKMLKDKKISMNRPTELETNNFDETYSYDENVRKER